MGLNSKSGKRSTDVSLLGECTTGCSVLRSKFEPRAFYREDVENDERPNKRLKSMDSKGSLGAVVADEWKSSSGPPSPVPFLSPDGRITKPAEIFRTDLISAMKLPDTQILNPENYMTIVDPWRQEWERGVQVPVHPEGLSQPSFSVVDTHKKTTTFKLSGKLLNSEDKRRGKSPCNYDLSRIDVEWLYNLNKSRRNKGRLELEEGTLEKAISYLEDKCYENMGHAIATQKGLSIEYDESVCCDVCQSPDSEEGNEMVFCDSCDICVHQACYGIQHIPSGSWLCRPCRRGVSKPACQLCSNPGGAMKQTKKGKNWIHVSCALWVPEVGFGSVEKMEPIIKLENIPAKRWNLVCFLCREKQGACIQCTVKTCMTAFHVTCGFQHGLEMKTILDDSAVDGVRHLCYCSKHSHKNKSPPRTPEKTKQDAEEAENIRQKRLKQMETEFYKYVDVAEAAKDLNIPKELAAHIHAFWTLKRKARDDLPLLPPSLEQQEKLCGKQGMASRSLQIQIEELMKMRCDLERLRNLCYMVGKREKMRRELFRAREQVFWKAHEVMTDETIDIDEKDLLWIREACGKNFSGDGSEPSKSPAAEGSLDSLSSSSAQSSNSGQTSSDDIATEISQSNEPSECSDGDVRGGYDSSDSEDSPQIKTRRRLRGISSHKSKKDVANRLKSDNQDSRGVRKSGGAKEATDPESRADEGEENKEGCDTPKRSTRTLNQGGISLDQNNAVDSNDEIKENLTESELPKVMTRRHQRSTSKQVTDDKGDDDDDGQAEEVNRIGLTRPRTRGQTSDSTSEDTESTRPEAGMPPSPTRSLRSSKQRKYEPYDRTLKSPGRTRSRSSGDLADGMGSDTPMESRITRSRKLSTKSEGEVRTTEDTEPEHKRVSSPTINGAKSKSLRLTEKDEALKENKILRENCLRKSKNRSISINESKTVKDVLPTKKQKLDVTNSTVRINKQRGRRRSSDLGSDNNQGKITDFFFKGSPRRKASTNPSRRDMRNSFKSRTTECENSKSDEENADDRVERLSSLRSFSTGKETNAPTSPCPKCQIQQENSNRKISADSTRTPERKNKELRPLNMQSPRSRHTHSPRARNMHSPRSSSRLLRCSPTRSCSSVIASVCHATSVI